MSDRQVHGWRIFRDIRPRLPMSVDTGGKISEHVQLLTHRNQSWMWPAWPPCRQVWHQVIHSDTLRILCPAAPRHINIYEEVSNLYSAKVKIESMSMWSLRWHFTNKSVTGAPYSIKCYSLSHSWTLWWRVRWLNQCRLEVAAELHQQSGYNCTFCT